MDTQNVVHSHNRVLFSLKEAVSWMSLEDILSHEISQQCDSAVVRYLGQSDSQGWGVEWWVPGAGVSGQLVFNGDRVYLGR